MFAAVSVVPEHRSFEVEITTETLKKI